MCIPGASESISVMSRPFPVASIANVVLNTTASVISQKANNDYRTQVALANAKYAQNEAHRQQQLGINKARAEKISGIQEANKFAASQAASNLDSSSLNSSLAYRDYLTNADINSSIVKDEYNAKAQSYFTQANSYLGQVELYKKDYNMGLITTGLQGLDSFSKVTKDWYSEL